MKRAVGIGAAALIAAAGLGLGFGVLHHGARSAEEAAAAAAAKAPFALRWPRGTRYLYDVAWRTHEASDVDGAKMRLEGKIELAGKLELRSFGERGAGTLVALRFVDLADPVVAFGGAAPVAARDVRAALEGQDAYATLDGAGRFTEVRFDANAPPLFSHVVSALLADASVHVSTDDVAAGAWRAREVSGLGVASSRYDVAADPDAAHLTVRRTRPRYTSLLGRTDTPTGLDAVATIVLARAGHVERLSSRETLEVRAEGAPAAALSASRTLELVLRSVDRFEAYEPDLSATWAQTPGELHAVDVGERARLEQRVAGLTKAELVRTIAVSGDGDPPDKKRFLWRATGLLRLDPSACRELVRTFGLGTAREKRLTLDVLAGAGTDAAQAAMREILASPDAKTDGPAAYAALVQRFGLVQHPDDASIRFVTAAYQGADGDDARRASAYALGSMAGNLTSGGDADGARAAVAPLVADLGATDDTGERAHLLTAIGNGAVGDNLPLVTGYAGDADDAVRGAVASALYKPDSSDARAALVTLVGDPSASVEQLALAALDHKPLADADLEALDAVVEQSMRASSDAALVNLLGRRLDGGPAVVRMLTFLADRPGTPPALKAQINTLLASAGGGS
ncbi:MAG TPA: HEAT repeat domain-containing protein [Byssovorax sp.]